MSNLGGYQRLTTIAKKVGGPTNLVLVIAGSGAVIYKSGELLVRRAIKNIKKLHSEKTTSELNSPVYIVNKQAVSNENLVFKLGDKFKVLEFDGDAVLIEKIGDSNNPYVASSEFLEKISNYKNGR